MQIKNLLSKRNLVYLMYIILALLILLFAGLFLAHGCGQKLSTGGSGSVVSTSVISGTVLVPSSSVSGLSVLSANVKASAVADDGVSDTPLAGASVIACDPVTRTQITGTTTATANSDGTFSIDVSNAVLPAGEILIIATKTSGDNVVLLESLTATNAAVSVNAGTALASAKVLEELSKKAGDLFSKATTLPLDKKEELRKQMAAIYSQVYGAIGTIGAGNIPSLVINNASGKSLAELEKLHFEKLTPEVAAEFSPPAGWNVNISNFYTYATTLVTGATYPPAMQVPTGYPSFILPPGNYLPSGAKFGYSPMGADFIPPDIYNKIPTGAYFGSGFIAPPTGMILPSGVSFGSGFTIPTGYKNELPTGAFFEGGCGIPSGAVLPPSAGFQSGFIIPTYVDFKTGFVMPSNISFQSGFIMPTNIGFQTGFVMPTGVSYQTGFVMPTGVSYQTGFVMPTGISYQTGFVMPSGVSYQSGFVMPSNVSFQSGFIMPSGVSYQSGFVPPSWMSYASGQQPPSGY